MATAGRPNRELTSQLLRDGTIRGADISSLDLDLIAVDEPVFESCTAVDARFRGREARGFVWRNCRFVNCEFVSSPLANAVFEQCQFFDGERGKGATFRFCDLSHARFGSCDLSLSTCLGCDLFDVRFESCRMRGASLEKCSFSRKYGKITRNSARLLDCNLIDARLKGIDLSGCVVLRCDLAQADLSETNLGNCDLQGCDLAEADLSDSDLSGADLRGAKLDGFALTRLRRYQGMRVSASQQHHLLRGVDIDVFPDEN
jgi:fluoroquinolone resistance protein